MGSLFMIVCPNKEREIILRRKEQESNLKKEIRSSFLASANTAVIIESVSNSDSEDTSLQITASNSSGLIPEELIDVSNQGLLARGSTISETDIEQALSGVFMEKHLEDCMQIFSIGHSSCTPTNDGTSYQIWFTVPESKTEKIIHHLQTCGFGRKYESTISVSAANVFITAMDDDRQDGDHRDNENGDTEDDHNEKKKGRWNDFVASIKSRLTVAQVVQTVTNNAVITFDYIVLITVAAMIAAYGLLEDSSVSLVASMLISPLMGPIMAVLFGLVVHDRALKKIGTAASILGLTLCLVVGLITGICIELQLFDGPWSKVQTWPTTEMLSRSNTRSLIIGALIAAPSGVGVALSILAGNSGSLVGVAISASLLPPAVNCGVFWGMAMVAAVRETLAGQNINIDCDSYFDNKTKIRYAINQSPLYCQNIVKEYALLGIFSFCLTLENIILIFIFGFIILKIKEFAPYTTRKNLNRFWKEDLKNVRKYNATHDGENRKEDIMKDINAVKDPASFKASLEKDVVYNQINRRTGATLQDLQVSSNLSVTDATPPKPVPVEAPAAASSGSWWSWSRKVETPAPPPEEPKTPPKPTHKSRSQFMRHMRK